jgi:2-iminobutanoate/2-iminopropanoate deaminase
MPTSRKGSSSNQMNGYNTAAAKASGQHITNSRHHNKSFNIYKCTHLVVALFPEESMKNVLIALVVILLAGSVAAQKQKKPTAPAEPFRISNPVTMFQPTNGYSMIAEVPLGNGAKMLYISGQVAIDKAGNLVGKDDFHAQLEQVFANLKSAVEATGGDFHDIIKLNYFCAESVDPSQVPAVRQVRDRYVNTANPPTSTFVFVKRLVRPEWMIEVEAVAVVKAK